MPPQELATPGNRRTSENVTAGPVALAQQPVPALFPRVRDQETAPSEQSLRDLARGLTIVALRSLGDLDAAQDASQEAMRRLLEVLHARGIPDGYTIESYGHGILRHVIADEQRRTRRIEPMQRAGESADHLPSPLELLVNEEQRRRMDHALRHLAQVDRDLLRRCYVDGERVTEIASQTGEPAERIRKRKSRALERLRQLLRRGHESAASSDTSS